MHARAYSHTYSMNTLEFIKLLVEIKIFDSKTGNLQFLRILRFEIQKLI